jgi:AAA+ ATPase superfamily predicted ATPase
MAAIQNKESPFTPGRPVPLDYFVARLNEVNRIEHAIRQASTGRNENVFITGERGIGKSSLASMIRFLADKEYGFLGVHCYLGGVRDVEGVVRIVFQRLLQQTIDKSLFDKLKNLFNKYIKGFTLFGVGVEFTNDPAELRVLKENFLSAVSEVYQTIKDQKKGILLILDDLNGVTGNFEFAPFIKSLVDELATSLMTFPLVFILVGVPERREDLIKHQPSVARIFDVVELSLMTNEESKEFFEKTFGKLNITVKPDALALLLRYSGGLPMLMHEIGDAVFWIDTDNIVDRDDAFLGILRTADNVGRKYLDPQVYQEIKSSTYRSILRKLGKLPFGMNFIRGKLIHEMTEKEKKNFDNFLQKGKKLGIITKGDELGEYRFVNQLFHLYVALESFRAEKEKGTINKNS